MAFLNIAKLCMINLLRGNALCVTFKLAIKLNVMVPHLVLPLVSILP